MKKYNRVMLGRGSKYAKTCRENGYIGANFDINIDLSDFLYDNWRDFNAKFVPIWMENVPGKSKTSAGLACGFLWTIVKGLQIGDIVLSPSGEGYYYVGEITSDYYYVPDSELPHRRKINWFDKTILRKEMSKGLQNSSGSIGTCCDVTKYASEIDDLISGCTTSPSSTTPAPTVVNQQSFDERSLHKLFCSSLRTRNIFAKTIYHEKSSTKADSAQKWAHPDIVGVQFEEFKNEATLALLKAPNNRLFLAAAHESLHIPHNHIDTPTEVNIHWSQLANSSNYGKYGLSGAHSQFPVLLPTASLRHRYAKVLQPHIKQAPPSDHPRSAPNSLQTPG